MRVFRPSRAPGLILLCAALSGAMLTGCAAATAATGSSGAESQRSPVIVTIGDSIMSGHGLDDGEDWPSMLSQRTGVSIDNLACSGAGFLAVGTCGQDFRGLVDAAVKDDPTLVIVQGSDNDVGRSDADITAATKRTVDAIHRAMPRAELVGLSTLWDPSEPKPAEIDVSSAAVRAAVTALGGRYIDIGQPLRGDPSLLQDDDEHPTVAGQQRLVHVIRVELEHAGYRL